MKRILIVATIIISLYFLSQIIPNFLLSNFFFSKSLEKVKVIEVVDGDTIKIDGNKKVRIIGTDTPEKIKSVMKRLKNFLKI